MLESHRIDEIVTLLEAYALGELTLPKRRVAAALKLLDLALDDLPPDDGGYEVEPVTTDYRPTLVFSRDFAA